ncbi:MAG: RyR domain-containing protein [Pseudomonadota bacterium]
MEQDTAVELEGDARVEAMARVVHEAVRAWQTANGQSAAPPWSKAPKWMRDSTAESVQFTLDNPDAPDSAQHDQWMEQKIRDGWSYGPIKDAKKKTHPMLKPYDALPDLEQRKDALFRAIVTALDA